MKKIIIILIIIIISCLYQTSIEPFLLESFTQDYYPHSYASKECPCLSCIQNSCIT